MTQNAQEPLWRPIVIAVIPLFFGSLLFSGILESYKNDASSKKEILNDFYRPMRQTQSECQKIHNKLVWKYGEVAGSFQLVANEMNHFTKIDLNSTTQEYRILLESIITNHTNVNSEPQALQNELEDCRAKLFQQYAELALVTGTYDQYAQLSSQRAIRINALLLERKSESNKIFESLEGKDLMAIVRELLQSRLESEEEKVQLVNRLNEFVNPVLTHFMYLSQNEQEIFNVDTKLFEDLHNVYSNEISDRFKRGLIARYVF